MRLCDGLFSALYQFDGELIHLVAQHNYTPEASMRRIAYTRRALRGPFLQVGRALAVTQVPHC